MENSTMMLVLLGGLAALLVGASKGGLPLVGVLGVPILTLVMPPVAAAALLLPIFIVSDAAGLWYYRKSYDRRNLLVLVPAAAVGIAIGWATAHITSPAAVTILVGLIGLGHTVNAFVGRGRQDKKAADVPRGLFWGALAGFASFVSHSGGPPFQIYTLPQRMEKLVFAGTSTIFFAILNILKIAPYWALGQFNPGNLAYAAALSPIAVGGAYLGYRATRWLPEKFFFRLVEAVLFLLSLKLIHDGLQGLP